MRDRRIWGWPIIGYLFLGGLGGGMMIISAVADLFWGAGARFALGNLLGAVIIVIGSGLLLFDLGRPGQFWRVFSRQSAVLTWGAWMLTLLAVIGIIYFSFWPDFSPWREAFAARRVFAWLNIFLGLGVCLYTGIFLGSMKSRPFWHSPLLPLLFLISGLSTGIAVQSLLVGSWPYSGALGSFDDRSWLRSIDIVIILVELITVFIYVMMMRTFFGEEARRMADSWLRGGKKLAFWGGLIGLGLLLPIALYWIDGTWISLISTCVLLGGLILRFLLIYSDERRKLPDEV